MGVQALTSAIKGRLRPSFFFLLWGWSLAFAQQAVYRCGHEYTNAPGDPQQCERVAPQAVTVIPGTQVQMPRPALPTPPLPTPPRTAGADTPQRERDEMARRILGAELEQARQRHARLQNEYRQGEALRTPDKVRHPQKYQERVAGLQAALERAQRDMDSLQRELMRRPALASAP